MSNITHVIPVTIRHQWYLRKLNMIGASGHTLMTSESFFSDALPNVKFHVFSGRSEANEYTAVVSKTPCAPANATIRIFVQGLEKKKVCVDGWTSFYIIDNISIYISTDPKNSNMILFECEIIWHGFVKKSPTPINLYHSMKNLFNAPELADIVIVVDDEEIPAHKVILAAQSPVFSAMVKIDMTESANNRIIIKDIDHDIMKKVIEFLYTGEIDTELDVDVVFSILFVADKYQIMALKHFCGEVLSMKLKINNALKILEEANLYTVPQLVEQTIIFMINNKHEIAKLDDLENFGCKNPKLLVKYMIRIIGISE